MRKKSKEIEERLITVALAIFAEKGFFRTTVEDIARAAQVAKGTLYLYFRDKESLYLTTLQRHFDRAITGLTEIETTRRSAEEKLRDIAYRFITYMTGLKDAYPMFTFENVHISGRVMKQIRPAIMPRIAQMTEIIGRIVEEGVKQGEFIDVDSRTVAFYFLSTIRTAFFSRSFMPEMFSDSDAVLRLFFRGLKKKEVF